MHRLLAAAALPLALIACASQTEAPRAAPPPVAQTAAPSSEPAPLSELVAEIDIPYEKFTLDNGLQVLVVEDRSAPMVAVGVWYDVGSKHEPSGKTGFAHLFEHIMGYGTENIPQGENLVLDEIGATGDNATTWFDRTNYFVTVPTNALDVALFAKSDQMGHLLGGVTEETLKNQIGVVQNEKRNALNSPTGQYSFEMLERLFPMGHPYRHSTIGSMADLDAASLDVVKDWFRQNYGPNNAVLVLVGDIDVATAREKTQKWFGAIPPGPEAPDVRAPVPTLAAEDRFTLKAPLPSEYIVKAWAMPGSKDPADNNALTLAAMVLGGLSSSRLDNELVRGEEIAVQVSASNQTFVDTALFNVAALVKPGGDPAQVEAALDAQLAKFLAEGPTEDELQRAKTVALGGTTRALDSLSGGSGRAQLLAEGELYFGDPEYYKRDLAAFLAIDAAQVKAAANRWLSRPPVTAILEPGRPDFSEDPGANAGGVSTEYLAPQPTPPGLSASGSEPDRSTIPPVGEPPALDYPEIQRATLSNGMRVLLIESDDVPTVTAQVSFDAGYAADPRTALGTQSLMIAAMDEGTQSYDPVEFAIAQERLGANIGGETQWDATVFSLAALSANLAPSLDLLAEYVRRPAFDAGDFERVRAQRIADIRQELEDPGELLKRVLYPVVYGPEHPYGIPPSGFGEEAAVAQLTPQDMRAFHDKWLRPDLATIYIVGDTTLAQATALLERSFGDWQAPPAPAPTKNYDVAVPTPQPRVVLIDTPGAPQAIIRAVRVLDDKGTDDLLALRTAGEVFGGGSLSRMFQEVRQARGWSYSPAAFLTVTEDRPLFIMHAPVQTDRTGDTVKLMRELIGGFNAGNPVTAEEARRAIESNRRSLPGTITTNAGLLSTLIDIDQFGREDTYYETLGAAYSDLDAQKLAAEAARELRGDQLVFFIVGDRGEIEPQLKDIGMPIEYYGTSGS